jgi:hypothetical protein
MPLKNTSVANVISIDNVHLKSEVYNTQNQILPINIEFINDVPGVNNIEVKSYPNPFTTSVQLEFNAFGNENAEINFFDITGQKIATKSVDVIAGKNNITLDSEDLGSYNGLIIYEIKLSSNVLSGRIIKK